MNQASGIQFNQREIVLVPFPYSDLTAIKKRPVLIVSNNAYNKNFEDLLVCVITSNIFKDEFSVDLNNNDLEIGTLPELSVVKAHKLFSVHQSKIIKKFGKVSKGFYEKVEHEIIRLVDSKSTVGSKESHQFINVIRPKDISPEETPDGEE